MKTYNKQKSAIKVVLILTCTLVWMEDSKAQKYLSKSNTISFFSEAPLENIEATNNSVLGSVNIKTGEIKSHAAIKHFEFEKDLMQKHFNEQFMESDKYPYAKFTGKFTDMDKLQKKENGIYNIKGDLTIHGVTQPLEETVQIRFIENQLLGKAKFKVKVADHDIKIPKLVIKNIAEVIEVDITFKLKKSDDDE